MQIDLTSEEREILEGILANYLSDLRMEISNTDQMDFRTMLKRHKAVAQKVLDALRGSVE